LWNLLQYYPQYSVTSYLSHYFVLTFVRYILTLIYYLIFIYLVCEAVGTAATPGLLCQPRVIVKMIVETQIECRLAGETEVLGENLPQRHFVHHKSLMTRPGFFVFGL
jgi:hypothetical protein